MIWKNLFIDERLWKCHFYLFSVIRRLPKTNKRAEFDACLDAPMIAFSGYVVAAANKMLGTKGPYFKITQEKGMFMDERLSNY